MSCILFLVTTAYIVYLHVLYPVPSNHCLYCVSACLVSYRIQDMQSVVFCVVNTVSSVRVLYPVQEYFLPCVSHVSLLENLYKLEKRRYLPHFLSLKGLMSIVVNHVCPL